MKRVIVLGKSDLAINLCEWVLQEPDFELIATVPCVSRPDWFADLGKWSRANAIPTISKGDFAQSKRHTSDIAVSCYYDQILTSAEIRGLETALNVHNSLLPRHRGVAPIEWALRNGDEFVGVTVHSIKEGIDSGEIWGQVRFDAEPLMTPSELHALCRGYGFILITHVLRFLDKIAPREQNESNATYNSKQDSVRLHQ